MKLLDRWRRFAASLDEMTVATGTLAAGAIFFVVLLAIHVRYA